MNLRRNNEYSQENAIENLIKGYKNPNYLFIEMLEKSQNYSEAFVNLANQMINSPTYYIISGRNESACIARDTNKPALIDNFDISKVILFKLIVIEM